MAGFLRKFFGQQQTAQTTEEGSDLEKFYTDSEHARQVFEQLATSTNLLKRILVIHGLGGVGKSTLLKMYDLTCRKYHIPAALVASEEAPSPADVLAEWQADLNHGGITLPTFQKTLNHYLAIQAKVEAEAKKGHPAASQIAGTMGKTVAKTAITMAASAIPVVGPLVGAVASESAEAFVDWLRNFLTKPDMDLYFDPTKRLDSDFLSDLTQVAARQRLVLMVDTYEQMTTLDNWMRELVRRLHKNVLLVIAGQTVPEWDRAWQDWMGKAEIVELKEMPPDDIRTLIQRYYAYIHSGEPDPKQVDAVVQFARGLPMVATTVVKLWVKYRMEDFQSVRPQVVADLVDRLLEGVPQEMRPAFEVAAVLRYFNVEVLDALLDDGNAATLYAELRRWPFIRSRREGLVVHATMREMMNEALHVRTPERFRSLHERAAAYYETRLEKAIGDERERSTLEQLYHYILVNEGTGVQLFQELAEELTRYRLVNRLRALLNDVNTYPLAWENSRLWREYYNARLAQWDGQRSHAEEIYQAIGENERAEPKLRAYALCDWGGMLRYRGRIHQPGVEERALHGLESSLELGGTIDLKLSMSWVYLGDIYAAKGDWEKALFYLERPKRFFTERSDYSSLLFVLSYERLVYWHQGNLRKTLDITNEMWNIYTVAGKPASLRTRILPASAWAWVGRYAQAEKELRVVLEVAKSFQDLEFLSRKTRDLALHLGLQGKCAEALATAKEGLSLASSFGSGSEAEVNEAQTIYGMVCMKCGKLEKAEQHLTQAILGAQKIYADLYMAPVYLGTVYEVLKEYDKAEHFYRLSQMEAISLDRNYVKSGALTGLVRLKHAQHDYATLLPLWTEAEHLAQQYEYNDYFTSLRLTRGHITWDGLIPEWESGFDSALHSYQHALIHALRYNRFLLDEALSGREQGTPLQPIMPHCLKHGEEGQRMLIALRDWWQIGTNDIGTPRSDRISSISEGIPLLEAEQIARQSEPGDGSSQKSVVEQINMTLQIAIGRASRPFPRSKPSGHLSMHSAFQLHLCTSRQ